MTYAVVHCRLFDEPTRIELTDRGWIVGGDRILSAAFNELANPRDYGPADGDPMAAAAIKLARMLGGTAEVVHLPSPGPGTLY